MHHHQDNSATEQLVAFYQLSEATITIQSYSNVFENISNFQFYHQQLRDLAYNFLQVRQCNSPLTIIGCVSHVRESISQLSRQDNI